MCSQDESCWNNKRALSANSEALKLKHYQEKMSVGRD
jgi:hypothetical protein